MGQVKMAKLIQLNINSIKHLYQSLSLPMPKGWNVVALRGCILPDAPHSLQETWNVQKSPLNYENMRCILGLWNPNSKQFFLVPGSTVPLKENVLKGLNKKGKGVNQMEPGFYTDLILGEHLQGKPRGHVGLRQSASRFFRRTERGIPYTSEDKLYFANPYDNLHCAWNLDPSNKGYSSSGCMVVAGLPHCPRISKDPHQGHYKKWIELILKSKQKNFSLLLLNFEMALNIWENHQNPLLFGSMGADVKILQQELKKKGLYKGPIHGILDARTYKAWNQTGFIPEVS